MNKKTLCIIAFTLMLTVVFSLTCLAKDKALKAKGQIVYNPDKNYVKVMDKNYKVITIYLDKKTKYEATVKAKEKDFSQEGKESRLPKGTVAYKEKDGKLIATKVSYKGRVKWGIVKKKKK